MNADLQNWIPRLVRVLTLLERTQCPTVCSQCVHIVGYVKTTEFNSLKMFHTVVWFFTECSNSDVLFHTVNWWFTMLKRSNLTLWRDFTLCSQCVHTVFHIVFHIVGHCVLSSRDCPCPSGRAVSGDCVPCQAIFVLSGEKFCACSKLGTDTTGQRHPLVVRLLCAEHAFWSELKHSLSCTCPFASGFWSVELTRDWTSTW